MNKFTKIVATISDKRCDKEFIQQLFDNGLNVVRMNSAHINREGFEKIIGNVRSVSDRIGILMDTKGPEVRTTTNINDADIDITEGDKVKVVGNPDGITSHDTICLSYQQIAEDVQPGAHLLIDDGELDFVIDSIADGTIYCTAKNSGSLGSRKSVNIPGAKICLPSLTQRDIVNIHTAIDLDIDFIAHSFVRTKQDVLDIQAILDSRGSHIKIIAKIENQEGIDNFDEILEVAYGVMIARGDLGIEVPAEKIPSIQNDLISRCIAAHKPVIVATQMLHSMITSPRPTRAEVSDIANAVYQRTDALMLSGETAYGKYPIEAISTMSSVAIEAESILNKMPHSDEHHPKMENDVTSFLAHQAVDSAEVLDTRAIITDSYTGRTARYIASFRGKNPTLALCYYSHVIRQLALSYGVFPVFLERSATSREYLYTGLKQLINLGLLKDDYLIAYIGGAYGEGRGTSFLEINRVGDILSDYDAYLLPNLESSATRDISKQG